MVVPMNDGNIKKDSKKWHRTMLSVVKLLITCIILYYIFYHYVDFNDFLTAFKNIQLWLLFVLLVISLMFRYLNAYQVHYYFYKVFDSKLGTNFVFKVQLITSFYGLVIPGDLAAA